MTRSARLSSFTVSRSSHAKYQKTGGPFSLVFALPTHAPLGLGIPMTTTAPADAHAGDNPPIGVEQIEAELGAQSPVAGDDRRAADSQTSAIGMDHTPIMQQVVADAAIRLPSMMRRRRRLATSFRHHCDGHRWGWKAPHREHPADGRTWTGNLAQAGEGAFVAFFAA